MNQLEYEALFAEEEPKLPMAGRFFSQGNHQRSLVNQAWYYFGEKGDEYALYKDLIVKEDAHTVWIDMFEDNTRMNTCSIAIDKDQLDRLYPVQSIFPHPMTDEEAHKRLRQYFLHKERSTTIDRPYQLNLFDLT